MKLGVEKWGIVGRWTSYGAFLGFAAIVYLATMSGGEEFYPWDNSDQIAFNIGRLLGGTAGGAILAAFLALIVRAIRKER